MDQRPNRHLFLVLLLLVCLPLYSSLPIQTANETFLAPTSGPIKDSAPTYKSLPLLQDSTGIYYIDVTWKNASSTPFLISDSDTSDFNDSSDEPAANAGKMVLALYTNISFVTICTNFLEYDCSSLDCQINSLRPIDQSYLLSGTEIEGYSIDVGVESPAFSMCGYSVIYAMTCGVGYPMQMSGYLGMGFSLNAFFEVNRNFSIFLSNGNDNLNSTLFIGSDDDSDLIDSSSNFMQSWLTDKDWTVFVTSVNAQAAGQPGSLSAGVIVANHSRALFDINTNAIGMAYDLFNNLSSILEEYGVTCTKSPYQPSCTYDGEVKSLPTFYLNLEDQNGTAIEINPEIYFVENAGQDTSYTLMFAAMASGIPGALQVSPKYENAIILGRPFMTYYYVHFSVSENYKQPSVTVYLAQHDSTTQTSNLKMILIIVGSVLGVVVVIGVGAFIFIRRRRKSQMRNRIQAEEDRPTVTTATASNRKEADKSVEASLKLKQPLLNASSDTSRDFIETTTKKEKDKVWNNNGFVDPDEMNACTYKKQNYRGLYESESDSLSLNDEIGAASR